MEELYTAYIITMTTKNGKKLYLTSEKQWSFEKDEAVWFTTQIDAVDFAESWFKLFDAYEIDIIKY